MRDNRKIGEGRRLREGVPEKEWMGCFLDNSKSFPYLGRPVQDCGPGRGGMVQDGGKRGGTLRNGSLQKKSGMDYGM